jgi:hypothetical protein
MERIRPEPKYNKSFSLEERYVKIIEKGTGFMQCKSEADFIRFLLTEFEAKLKMQKAN